MEEREVCVHSEEGKRAPPASFQMRFRASGKLRRKVSGTRAVLVLLPSWWIDQCLSCGILPGEKRFVDSNRGRHSTWFCGQTCRVSIMGEVTSKFVLVNLCCGHGEGYFQRTRSVRSLNAIYSNLSYSLQESTPLQKGNQV